MQEWLEENEGGPLLETLYKALDEVSSTLPRKKSRIGQHLHNISRLKGFKIEQFIYTVVVAGCKTGRM